MNEWIKLCDKAVRKEPESTAISPTPFFLFLLTHNVNPPKIKMPLEKTYLATGLALALGEQLWTRGQWYWVWFSFLRLWNWHLKCCVKMKEFVTICNRMSYQGVTHGSPVLQYLFLVTVTGSYIMLMLHTCLWTAHSCHELIQHHPLGSKADNLLTRPSRLIWIHKLDERFQKMPVIINNNEKPLSSPPASSNNPYKCRCLDYFISLQPVMLAEKLSSQCFPLGGRDRVEVETTFECEVAFFCLLQDVSASNFCVSSKHLILAKRAEVGKYPFT